MNDIQFTPEFIQNERELMATHRLPWSTTTTVSYPAALNMIEQLTLRNNELQRQVELLQVDHPAAEILKSKLWHVSENLNQVGYVIENQGEDGWTITCKECGCQIIEEHDTGCPNEDVVLRVRTEKTKQERDAANTDANQLYECLHFVRVEWPEAFEPGGPSDQALAAHKNRLKGSS